MQSRSFASNEYTKFCNFSDLLLIGLRLRLRKMPHYQDIDENLADERRGSVGTCSANEASPPVLRKARGFFYRFILFDGIHTVFGRAKNARIESASGIPERNCEAKSSEPRSRLSSVSKCNGCEDFPAFSKSRPIQGWELFCCEKVESQNFSCCVSPERDVICASERLTSCSARLPSCRLQGESRPRKTTVATPQIDSPEFTVTIP